MVPNIKALRARYKAGTSYPYEDGSLHRLSVAANSTSRRIVGRISGMGEEEVKPASDAVASSAQGLHAEAGLHHRNMEGFHRDAAAQIGGLANDEEEGTRAHRNFLREAREHEQAESLHREAARGHAGVHSALEHGRELRFHAAPANGDEYAVLADYLEEQGHGEHAEALRRAVYHLPRKG